jgi:hypothetical protein
LIQQNNASLSQGQTELIGAIEQKAIFIPQIELQKRQKTK